MRETSKKSPSVAERVHDLCENPFKKAIPTNIAIIGTYYSNCGRWCLLFDIDEDKEMVDIVGVMADAKLHKILTGRISPEL